MAGHNGVTNFRGAPRDCIQHTIRHTGLLGQRQQRKGTQRRVVCRFDHTGTPCCQRRAELTGEHGHREVPWRDSSNHPDRFTSGQNTGARFNRRNDFPVGALGLLGKPLNEAGSVVHLTFSLFQRLALLGSHQPPEPAFVLDNQFIPAIEDRGTLFCRFRAPCGKGFRRGRNGLFGFGFPCFRHFRDHLARGRV